MANIWEFPFIVWGGASQLKLRFFKILLKFIMAWYQASYEKNKNDPFLLID